MKRRDLLKAGGLGILAFVLRNLPVEGAEGRSGAIKLVLRRRSGEEEPGDAGVGEPIGWAIVNTTAEDQLSVLVDLSKAAPQAEYFVYVEVNGEWREEDVVVLSTDDRGTGTVRLVLDPTEYPESWPAVGVQVKMEGEEAGFAGARVPVRLKKKAKKKATKKKATKKKAKKKATKKKTAKKKATKKKAKKKATKKKAKKR
ncbi:MAG: hypothetical protein JSU70_01520 [Phycisphaerales bacterium]|nr:MAG: hypothetical protein JSU70_01520 [Phycisphaerales bacterium]